VTVGRLRIEGVRCLEQVEVSLDSRRNYFFGANGAGKTSLLEAVYLLGRGRSFRTRQTARLVRRGARSLAVYGEVEGPSGEERLGIAFSGAGLQVRVNGREGCSLADLARALPVHVIDPKLHRLIEAGPSERRRYLDAGVFHVEHEYLDRWRAYRRLLGQRNAALQRGVSDDELAVWTAPFIAAGEAVDGLRRTYMSALEALAAKLGRDLLGTELTLGYRAGWRRGVSLAEAVEEAVARDRAAGYSQVGPHRADLKIGLATNEVRDSASRGQQKLVAAALVIAQVDLFQSRTGRRSTLLVDDPAAELDAASLERLLAALEDVDAQQLITALDHRALAPAQGFPVFHVEQGTVHPVL